MKFGLIKSKIESKLLESYSKNTFDKEIKNFNSLIVKNKSIGSIFYLYDELTSNKGLNEETSNDFINESIKIYENNLNKITNRQLYDINKWVGTQKTKNKYHNIDRLFSNDVLKINEKIESKKRIVENLKKKPIQVESPINLPLNSMVNIANKTINSYISKMSESEKKQLNHLLSESDEVLEKKFIETKNTIIKKLTDLKKSEDKDLIEKLNESIEKISNEIYSKFTYYKLKSLVESI